MRPNWGPEASDVRVKVYYHTKTPDGGRTNTNWATMEHREYFRWLTDAPRHGHVLERVEQMREG